MSRSLELARCGLGKTSPNPPVGSIILDAEGKEIGSGFHQQAGGPHAEIEALRSADESVQGGTIVVTLEPCSTTGRTGPCVEAIREAGLSTLVFGTADPNPHHRGRGLDRLRDAGLEVIGPVLEEECRHLIRFFAHRMETGRPYVIGKTGMTLDGRIQPVAGSSSPWITSPEARQDVQRLRSEVDAILIGGETLRQDDPRLTLRGEYATGRSQPWRVIRTRSGDLPQEAQVFTDEHGDRTLVFQDRSWSEILEDLASRGCSAVLLECGGRLMEDAFASEIVDEVCVYVAPTIGGGERRFVEGLGFAAKLGSMKVTSIGPDLRIQAPVQKSKP
ncbi:MAG: bifunctional diaminohydroxyphosphoribosylaminopyrimidine deaminase/5-amino-6-(5-phosphoribosylamino)uracil reductase RibD [Verrucomicrobiota bacterium]